MFTTNLYFSNYRKVASVSGDARRALDICRRAAEIAESEGKNALVSMNHVNEALTAMITQPKVKAIKYCSRLQQLILQAVVAEVIIVVLFNNACFSNTSFLNRLREPALKKRHFPMFTGCLSALLISMVSKKCLVH